MNYTHICKAALGWSLAAALAVFACKGGDRAQPLGGLDNGGGGGQTSRRGNGGSGGSGQDPDAGADASTSASATNCGALVCRGAGKCVVTDDIAECVCDPGYVLANGECIVDETCINLRLLEKGCRQLTAREPALGIFFGLETCAGTTVRSDVIGPLNQAFKVLEDGNPLGDESYVALFDRDVESYVSIALDLSGSLQSDSATLSNVIDELIQMVQSLQPPGAPPVRVQLIVFGRNVRVLQGFTSDVGVIAMTLGEIRDNPAIDGLEPGGTNLFGAINLGMELLDLALDQRLEETLGSVVTTGTLVTITDGRDNAGARLATLDKRFNYISIGISNNIDDADLSRIGPQGSFLAPSPADRDEAFDRVVARVLEYPQRSYLLAYCSPAVAGTHTVSVTLASGTPQASATCRLQAEKFGVGVASCNAAFMSGYCASRSCGSFLACGDCVGTDAGPPEHADDLWDFTLSGN